MSLGVLLIVGGATAYLAGTTRSANRSASPTAPAPPPTPMASAVVPSPPPTASAAAPSPRTITLSTAPAAPPRTVELRLEGAPRGARVWVDGKTIGEASAPLTLTFGEAPVQITVAAPGYESATLAVLPNQALRTTVTLRKHAAGAARRPALPRDLESPF